MYSIDGASEKRRFAAETPKQRGFSKTDLAKYLNACEGQPHLVSFGNQKNFQSLTQGLKERFPDGFVPDESWFRAFVAKAILFRAVQAIVKARKFGAYQANISAYTVACLSWQTGGHIDFERIWLHQAISTELGAMIGGWTDEIDRRLRATAKTRMPSEWAKKAECWEAIPLTTNAQRRALTLLAGCPQAAPWPKCWLTASPTRCSTASRAMGW
jgi:hypothetical protein